MQTKDTILHLKPNQKAPAEYLQAAVAFGATICGAVVIEDGKLTVNKIDAPTVEKLQDLQEIFPDRDIVVSLSDQAQPVDPKSRQPFVLQYTDDGEPAIVAFIEGDYSKHTVKDGIGSDAYYACTEHIEPLVELFWTTTNGDVSKVFDLLNSKSSNATLHGLSGERGNMLIVFNNGKMVEILKNDQDAEFEWGDVSRHHDYGAESVAVQQPAAPAVPAVETSAQKMARIMGGSVGDTAVKLTPAAQKEVLKKEVLKEAAKENLSSTKATDTIAGYKDIILVDISGYSNGQRKKFFDKYNKGLYPDNFKNMKTFPVPVSEASTEMLAQAKRTEPTQKDTTPKVVTSDKALPVTGSKGSVPTVASTLIVPIIPIDQIKAFRDTFLNLAEIRKIMQDTGGNVPDASTIQKMEEAFPKWAKQTDFPLVRAALFSHSAFTALVRDYPQLASCLLGELSHSYLRNFKTPATQAAPGTTVLAQDNQRAVGNGQSSRRR